jgi:hypothetical protein
MSVTTVLRESIHLSIGLLSALTLATCSPTVTDPQVSREAPSNGPPAQGDPAQGVTVAVAVEKVDLIRLESYPAQMQIVVHGTQVEGVPIDVEQERNGNVVVVTMRQTHPPEQAARKVAFEKSVHLDGGFPEGTYTLRVNDYETTFTI